MKKYFLILVVGIMSGCSITQTCVQVSPVAKRTLNGNHVYFINNETGSMVYRAWISGVFGDKTKPHLVDSVMFFQIPIITSASASVNQTTNSNVVTK